MVGVSEKNTRLSEPIRDLKMVLSEWLVLATAGATVDGRIIEEQWLRDAAETYSTDYYTAVIDSDHDLDTFGSFGHVHEVRLGKNAAGVITLEGRIAPNIRLLDMNQFGQRMWFSCWFEPNFANSEKTYLFRLAVTDAPASTGTSRFQFNCKKTPGTASVVTEAAEFSPKFKKGVVSTLKELMKKFSVTDSEHQNPEQDEHTMTPEQLEALTAQNNATLEAVNGVAAVLATIATTQGELLEAVKALKPAEEQEEPEEVKPSESEQLSALKTQLEDLKKQFNTPNGKKVPQNGGDAADDDFDGI